MQTTVDLAVALFTFGLASTGFYVVNEVIWANYFGRISLGTVRGMAQPITGIFSALGPLGMGVIYDATGSYDIAWMALLVSFVIAAVVVMGTRPPRPSQPMAPA